MKNLADSAWLCASIQAVRIDSGDLGEHARRVRSILGAGGLAGIRIFAGGNLDERTVQALVRSGAPIDGFGVGTRMNTAADQPYLDCVYKLQEYAGLARRKLSEGKATWPGRKQVFRHRDREGRLHGDTLALDSEQLPGRPLLHPVMRAGRRVAPLPALAASREHARAEMAALSPALRHLNVRVGYPMNVSVALRELAGEVDRRMARFRTPVDA